MHSAFQVGLVLLASMLGGYYLKQKSKGYKIMVQIHEVRSGVKRVKFDRAKLVKKETVNKIQYELQLLKSKIAIPIPSGSRMSVTNKGADFFEVYSPGTGQYYPILLSNIEEREIKKPKIENGKEVIDKEGNRVFETIKEKFKIIKPIPSDMMLLMSLMTRQAYARFNKKTTWEKIAPIVTIAVTGIVMTIFVYMSVSQLIKLSAASGAIAKSALDAAQGFKEAAQALLAAKGIQSPPI